MARIRTVKPELARHTGLYDLERTHSLPVRLVWALFPTVCDKAGRFKWRPKELKLDLLPYDDVDFEGLMNLLHEHGYLVRYQFEGQDYGCIPTFGKHQVVNHREADSKLPAVENSTLVEFSDTSTRAPRVLHACPTRHGHARGEGKGKGTGRELELEGEGNPPEGAASPANKFIATYVRAYDRKYTREGGKKARPSLTGKVAGQIERFVAETPLDRACALIETYLSMDDQWFLTKAHDFGTFIENLSKVGLKLDTGQAPTRAEAKNAEDADYYQNQLKRIASGEL